MGNCFSKVSDVEPDILSLGGSDIPEAPEMYIWTTTIAGDVSRYGATDDTKSYV
jgi:hypothetical protein